MTEERDAGAGPSPEDGSATVRALADAMNDAAPSPPQLPEFGLAGATQPVVDDADPTVAPELTRMRESADLSTFPITARRPVIGMRTLKRLLRRLLYQVFARQTDFNDATMRAVSGLLAAERGARATRRELAGTEARLRRAEAEIDALRTRTHGLERDLAAARTDAEASRA